MWYEELRMAARLLEFWTLEYLSKYSKQQTSRRMARVYQLALKLRKESYDWIYVDR